MKYIKQRTEVLISEQRWDIDYHLPPIETKNFHNSILSKIEKCADIVTEKRNPTLHPDEEFIYIDISSVDVITGMITTPQEMLGSEAPSRARKVVREGDIIISTCRPTRGAIAIIPKELDNQICSTGFSVIRAKDNVDIRYLHFILRSNLVKEQFRKFSTGSSYPAILDSDVKKTIIPLPSLLDQERIAQVVYEATKKRNALINKANQEWENSLKKSLIEIQDISN